MGEPNPEQEDAEQPQSGEVVPATAQTRAFATLWDALKIDRDIAFDATIRPTFVARTEAHEADQTRRTEPQRESGITIATLPRLSIDLRLPDARAALATEVGGDIVITGILGEGGMGRVFSAHQRSLSREVAVKTVHDHFTRSDIADALVTEGLITGHLEHPNITPVHQLGIDGRGRPLLVMKRIIGTVWADLIQNPNHPEWTKLDPKGGDRLQKHIEVLMQVTNGVAFAHSRNVVHRDIKPDNVMIGEFGETYLCDWGIAAKLPIEEGAGLVGTPSYLAPEMLDPNGEIGPWTDVYLLGGTLHTILMGTPRHEGTDVKAVLERAFESEPVDYPESVPRELAELANRATSQDPTARVQTAFEFREALAAYLSHETSRTLSRAATERLPAFGATAPVERAEALRKLIECRFGFAEALKAWPENEEAQVGFECAMALQLELEMANENVAGARSVLAEMEEPDAALSERVDALAKKLAARSEDAASLHKIRYEQDASVGASARTMLILVLLTIGGTMTVVLGGAKLAGASNESAIMRISPLATILIATSLGFWIGRKQLLQNQIGRRMAALVLGAMTLELVHRIEGFLAGVPAHQVMLGDTLIPCAATAAGALFLSRSWLLPAAALLAASILMLVVPSLTEPLFVAAHMAIFIFIAFVWGKAGKRKN